MWTQESIEKEAANYTHNLYVTCEKKLGYLPKDKLPFIINNAFIAGCKYIIDNKKEER